MGFGKITAKQQEILDYIGTVLENIKEENKQ